MGVGDRADMNNKKHKAPTINQEEVHYDSYSKDDGSRDNERPAPATITVRPEGRDDSAQDVTNWRMGIPDTHYESTTVCVHEGLYMYVCVWVAHCWNIYR